LKLEAYSVVIKKAVEKLSKYRKIDLSSYKSIAVENVRFINAELENLEKTCVQASDVLSCISIGISTAINDRVPYKNTPILIETVGAFGIGKNPKQLPAIPYAGITMAGISWGISGNLAKSKAQEAAVEVKLETEKISGVLTGLKAIEKRVTECEVLLFALSGKLKKSLDKLQSLAGESIELSEEAAKEIDVSVQLIKSLKQVIETDICSANDFLTKKSGVIFSKIKQEVRNV
jgi:hypothetical protein